jgi:hypothetical protein
VKVGGYGGDADRDVNPGPGGWGATGNGGRGGGASRGDGGGGGGATGIAIGACAGCAGSTVLVAGGGGGAGGVGSYSDVDNGGPGGSSGATVDPGHQGQGVAAGTGGGGGANGSPPGGGGGNGKDLGGAGGGGGAGGVGGSGGAGGRFGGGGGGGGGAGSSHPSPQLGHLSIVRGTTSDGNGLVAITWADAVPNCLDQTLTVPLDSPGVPVQLRCAGTSRPTSFRIVATPEHGHLDNRDLTRGSFTYVALPGYSGLDTMTFQALTDGAASVPATVTFVVDQTVPPMSLTASSTQVVVGRPPTFTVTPPKDATGRVGFYDQAQPGADKGIGTAPIVDGVGFAHRDGHRVRVVRLVPAVPAVGRVDGVGPDAERPGRDPPSC